MAPLKKAAPAKDDKKAPAKDDKKAAPKDDKKAAPKEEKKEEPKAAPAKAPAPVSQAVSSLSRDEVEEVKDVFELFDFWDGRDGEVDAFKTGDMLYCLGFNPTQEVIKKHGGTDKMGEKGYKIEEFLPIYADVSKIEDAGTFNDFNEAFKTFDREGQGFISSAELRHVLTCLGDKLSDAEVDEILNDTDTREDLEGNFKFADFISKVLKGPFEK